MKRVVTLLISCAVLTGLSVSPAVADRITEFERQVLKEERYHRAQEKAAIQEEQQEREERVIEKKRRDRRLKNLRAQQKRPVYEFELEGDELEEDLEDLE